MQVHVAVALNLWCNLVVNVILWPFCKIYCCRIPQIVFVNNFRLLRYIFNTLSLIFILEKCLQANLSKKAKTMSLPLQPIKPMFSNICMALVIFKLLKDLLSLKLPISC